MPKDKDECSAACGGYRGCDAWPDNQFTRELRTWPSKFAADPEIECPTQEVLDKAATLSRTVPSDFRMVISADGGVVFEAKHGTYHVWDDGVVEWIGMRNGKVYARRFIPCA